MSEIISEAEMPTYSSDTWGQLKESVTKAEKQLPTDDVADLAYLLFPALLQSSFIDTICCEKSL